MISVRRRDGIRDNGFKVKIKKKYTLSYIYIIMYDKYYEAYTRLLSTHGSVGTMASFSSHVKFPTGLDMHSNAIPRLSLSMAI